MMAKYRKKPVVVEATQWFKNGDHPDDDCEIVDTASGGEIQGEGGIVRHYRRPDIPGEVPCHLCGVVMLDHGWIEMLEGGHTVCPGDWIITGVENERYPCKPRIFEATYEAVPEPTP